MSLVLASAWYEISPVMFVFVLVLHLSLGLHDTLHLLEQGQIVSVNLISSFFLKLNVHTNIQPHNHFEL